MSKAKGYVVRGKRGSDGAEIAAWTHDGGIGSALSAAMFRTKGGAAGAADALTYRGCTDVRIFAVAKDGTETVLPTYEQALAELAVEHARLDQAGALAVLEAAERRLLEAGGWEERDAGWLDGQRRLIWTRENAVKIERNRQATKAGVLRAKEER